MKNPKNIALLPLDMRNEYEDMLLFWKNVCFLNENNYLYQLRYRIIKIMEYMTSIGHTSMKTVLYDDYLNYIQSMGNMSKCVHQRHLHAIRKVCEWAYHKGHGGTEMIVKIGLLKTPRSYQKPEPAPFSDKEISQIFKNIDEKFPYDPLGVDKIQRDMATGDLTVRKSLMNVQLKALVWILLETGCRISEAFSLNADDVDPINDTIGVVGKYQKWREIPYSDFLREKLKPWLAHRKLLTDDETLWLALWGSNMADETTEARPVAYGTFYNWSAYLVGEITSTNVGIVREGKGRWHRFRKTFATRSNELGLDIGVTSKVLGHEDTKVTMRYIGINKKRIIAESKTIEVDRAEMYQKASGEN